MQIRIFTAMLVLLATARWGAGAAPAASPPSEESASAACGGLWLSGGELHDAATGVVIWREMTDPLTALACQGGGEPLVAVGAAHGGRGEGRIVLMKPGAAAGAPWVFTGEIAARGVPSWLALESGRLAAVLEGRRGSSFGIVDAKDGAKLQTVLLAQPPAGLGVSPGGERFVLAAGSDLRTFRVDDGLTRAIIPFPEPIVALAAQKSVGRILVGQGSAVVAVDPRDKPDRGGLPVRARAELPRPAKRLVWIDGGRAAGALIADPGMLLVLGANDLSILEVREQEADAIGPAGASELLWVRGGHEKTSGIVRLSAPPPEVAPYEPAPLPPTEPAEPVVAPPVPSPAPTPAPPTQAPPKQAPPAQAMPLPPVLPLPAPPRPVEPPAAKVEPPSAVKATPPPEVKADSSSPVKAEPAPVKAAPPPVLPPPPPSSRAEPSGAKVDPPPAAKTEPPAIAKTEPPAATKVAPPAIVKTEPPAAANVEPPAIAKVEPPAIVKAEPPAAAKTEPPAIAKTEPPAVAKTDPPALDAVKPPVSPPPDIPDPKTPPHATPPPGAPPAPSVAQAPAPESAQVPAPGPAGDGALPGGSITGTFTGRPALVEEVVVLGPDSLLKQFARVKVTQAAGGASFTIDHVPPGRYIVSPMGAHGASLSVRPTAARIVVTHEAGARADFEVLGAL